MKDLSKYFFIISIVFVFFSACSKEKDDSNKIVKKIIEITKEGKLSTTLFKYNGRQIVSTDSPKIHIDYTYKDSLISKIVTKDKETQHSVTLEYTYVNGKLMHITSSENYVINYIYNNDQTISYEKVAVKDENKSGTEFHGILYFKNKNLIKDERILDAAPAGVISTVIINFEYDIQKNPFYNIVGYDKLLDHEEAVSYNNKIVALSENKDTYVKYDQITSSMNLCRNGFKYGKDSYPVERISESSGRNADYLKRQYFY